MYRIIAPWATENPLMMHCRFADERSVVAAIDQCAAVGFEMVILTFGSGFDLENPQPATIATAPELRRIRSQQRRRDRQLFAVGLAVRRGRERRGDAAGAEPHVRQFALPGQRMGQKYFRRCTNSIATAASHCSSTTARIPATCARGRPSGTSRVGRFAWTQWRTISDFYKWCRGQGIYLNVPDHYFLAGSNKTPWATVR